MDNSYNFSAVRGVQAGRAFYVAMVPFKILERMFSFDDEDLPQNLRFQRNLNKGRVPTIARYVTERASDYVLSALSATIDGAFAFEPLPGQRSVGTLVIDISATILINDGQHRRAGIIEALRIRPTLGDETIAVTLYPDEGLKRSQQMFVDLNQHGVKPARSLRLFYDSQDESARLTRAVAEAVALFRNLTEFSRSSLSSGSRKLFIFSNLHAANSTLVKDACLAVTPENPGLAVEFWQGVIENMPDWSAAGRREVAPAELRRDMVHAHGVALEAIALAGARMINEHPHNWKASLHGLREIDWTRSNAAAWEGRALSNGRITRTRTGVLLTAELISRALRSRLA